MTAPQTPSFPSSTTRTTIMIAGASQQVRLDVTSALTASAAVFATIGAVRMVFTDPAVVRGLVAVLRRPVADGVTTVLPEQFLLRPERFAAGEHVVTVNWSTVPPSKITPGGAFDPQRRRHIHHCHCVRFSVHICNSCLFHNRFQMGLLNCSGKALVMFSGIKPFFKEAPPQGASYFMGIISDSVA